MSDSPKPQTRTPRGPSVFAIIGPYRKHVALLLTLAVASNGLNLIVPRLVAQAIDAAAAGSFVLNTFLLSFLTVVSAVFVVSYGQTIAQTYVAERVARDLRERLIAKISAQNAAYIQTATSSKLLTHLTSDVDAIKTFASQAIVSIVSSIVLILGASILLLSMNWKLALAVLAILPIIGGSFFMVFSRVGVLFKRAQEMIDRLNNVINESILGAALVRVLNAQVPEYQKFLAVNTEAKNNGLNILKIFASTIPIITFVASLATIILLTLGGHFVIHGQMTLGELAAFQSYLSILIFPIFIIGFMSNAIARAQASYARVHDILHAPEPAAPGTRDARLTGKISVEHVTLTYGETSVLRDVSFEITPGTRTAIIGPTAAGKTQLLNILTGLTMPTSGRILYDGYPLSDYDPLSFHEKVAFVFQDSILFNTTLRDNIAFHQGADEAAIETAIKTAELSDFIATLPNGLDTMVSERGTTLSGGQKQRVMLARALALNPTILVLDDFTARVDAVTEARILKHIHENYPNITLVSVTQKIAPIESYDHIILLMEGEILAQGTHAALMQTCPEYVQIAESQRTTTQYESNA
jgi:ATP-binding cassette subfamily B protein